MLRDRGAGMRTQVAIVGGGPSGLLLGQLLHGRGIDTVVVERRSREHVLGRIRAGVLERGTADLLRQAGAGARMEAEGLAHHGIVIAGPDRLRIDFAAHGCGPVLVYGQTELTRDLYAARDAAGAPTLCEAEEVAIEGVEGCAPCVTCTIGGEARRIACDFVIGCDGFHGVSRRTIPDAARTEVERVYPFAWLGVLSRTPPVADELIYAASERGFALCSMRSPEISRHYVQCPAGEDPAAWTDEAFWDELRRRLPRADAEALVTGPSIEKGLAPLRSFVCEPMRWGRLFLCGDAAHIVPPTGAKGLNTAAADVHYLHEALLAHYEEGDDGGIERYSERALARVWKVQRFSWWMTSLLHSFPEADAFDMRMRRAALAHLADDPAAQASLAAAYVGLPY